MSFITLLLVLFAIGFPALMLCFTYPLSHKWALFWSNYITTHTDRLFFAIFKRYRGFHLLMDEESKKLLPPQFLVISNHQSLIDIVVYLNYFAGTKVRFVAKDTLNDVPMVGKMLRSQEHCLVPRSGSPSVAMKTLEKFGTRVNADKSITPVIFPEGTRSKDGKLGKFYSAGFRRLEQTVRLPVAVCVLDGGWKLSDLKHILGSLRSGAYRVKVLKVYDAPAGKEEEKKILEEAPALMQAQLDAWRKLPAGSLDV